MESSESEKYQSSQLFKSIKKYSCSMSECNKKSLKKYTCSICYKNYCVEHKLHVNHTNQDAKDLK
jgi:hypothetical protein